MKRLPVLDRSAILCDARSRARFLQHQERHKRADWRVWDHYRAAFAYGLREAWRAAKARAAQVERDAAFAAAEAVVPALPADVARRVADLHILAGVQPLNSYGAAHFRAIRAEADDIARAARCSMIPAQDHSHHAH